MEYKSSSATQLKNVRNIQEETSQISETSEFKIDLAELYRAIQEGGERFTNFIWRKETGGSLALVAMALLISSCNRIPGVGGAASGANEPLPVERAAQSILPIEAPEVEVLKEVLRASKISPKVTISYINQGDEDRYVTLLKTNTSSAADQVRKGLSHPIQLTTIERGKDGKPVPLTIGNIDRSNVAFMSFTITPPESGATDEQKNLHNVQVNQFFEMLRKLQPKSNSPIMILVPEGGNSPILINELSQWSDLLKAGILKGTPVAIIDTNALTDYVQSMRQSQIMFTNPNPTTPQQSPQKTTR